MAASHQARGPPWLPGGSESVSSGERRTAGSSRVDGATRRTRYIRADVCRWRSRWCSGHCSKSGIPLRLLGCLGLRWSMGRWPGNERAVMMGAEPGLAESCF